MKHVWRAYASLCGLVVGPVALAVLLALGMGALPGDRVEGAFALLKGEAELPAEPETETPEATEVSSTAPEDLRVWEHRLEAMGDGIVSSADDLGRAVDRLQQLEARLAEVQETLAKTLTVTLETDVNRDTVISRADDWIAQLEKKRSAAERFPKMLAALSTIEPRNLAQIVAGRDGGEGMAEEQTVAVLEKLPPRKAGSVLSEVGKLDPALAARLAERMGEGK